MRQKSISTKDAAEKTVRDIRRRTRKQYSAEEKIRIVLEGLRGEESIANASTALVVLPCSAQSLNLRSRSSSVAGRPLLPRLGDAGGARAPCRAQVSDGTGTEPGRGLATFLERARLRARQLQRHQKQLNRDSVVTDPLWLSKIVPMHIIEGKGALIGLLRATPEGVPPRSGPRGMYAKSGVGEADYQRYDRTVTEHAVRWLRQHGRSGGQPWILLVSYASPHPPFAVPKRLIDLYPPDRMPLPAMFRAGERPNHPAIAHVRRVDGFEEPVDEAFIRRTVSGYCALVTHLDEQVGTVMREAEELGLLETTRVLYTSDHGEAAGHHGLFGKSVLYEHSIGVPLLLSGPGVPEGRVVQQIASHVDLFPTIVETVKGAFEEADGDLPGISLWPAIKHREASRFGFAEFHAQSSKTASFMLRDGTDKLIYNVDMPPQVFDLAADPDETIDLNGTRTPKAADLEAKLRTICDPEAVERRAKADQLAHADHHGGAEAIRRRGTFAYTPVPGDKAAMETYR